MNALTTLELDLVHWIALLGLVLFIGGCALLLAAALAMWRDLVAPTLDAIAGDGQAVQEADHRTACQQHPGMCAGDPACSDRHCPGHPWNNRRCRSMQP